MKIDCAKFEIVLARQQKVAADLRSVLSPQTLSRLKKEQAVTTRTVGKIAATLGVDVTELIKEQ